MRENGHTVVLALCCLCSVFVDRQVQYLSFDQERKWEREKQCSPLPNLSALTSLAQLVCFQWLLRWCCCFCCCCCCWCFPPCCCIFFLRTDFHIWAEYILAFLCECHTQSHTLTHTHTYTRPTIAKQGKLQKVSIADWPHKASITLVMCCPFLLLSNLIIAHHSTVDVIFPWMPLFDGVVVLCSVDVAIVYLSPSLSTCVPCRRHFVWCMNIYIWSTCSSSHPVVVFLLCHTSPTRSNAPTIVSTFAWNDQEHLAIFQQTALNVTQPERPTPKFICCVRVSPTVFSSY